MNRMKQYPVRWKLIAVFLGTSILVATINIIVYFNLQGTIGKIDTVYTSNETLNELEECLENVQDSVYRYLNTKNSEALREYYQYEQEYRHLVEGLNHELSDQPIQLMEKNIYNLSDTYLQATAGAVEGKRARNISSYKEKYHESTLLYTDIEVFIRNLNNTQLQNNSQTYAALRTSLNLMVLVGAAVLILILVFNAFFVTIMTRSITQPLVDLAKAAGEVGKGNFETTVPGTDAKDELGTVTRAFNKMVESIRNYITQTKETYERENQLVANELSMKNDLKDAQLKYLQAQINPHFLFNTLNAGAQLAMMEGAENTCLFVENMADFFRYNVRKSNSDVTLEEEIELVDNYIYILNVRFTDEINFHKQLDAKLLRNMMPSMILQPIVENAVNHGIRGVEWEGHIWLKVYEEDDKICVSVKDNGHGMEEEAIQKLFYGEDVEREDTGDTTGIGMDNVISRLRRYYEIEDVIDITSDGIDKGTTVIVKLPRRSQGE